MTGKMEVIDLMDDTPQKEVATAQNGEIDRVNCRLGRKAANQISNDYPQYEWVVINSIVQAFCNENPYIVDKKTIVQRCLERLDPAKHTPNKPSTSSQPPVKQESKVKQEAVTIADSTESEDDFEEVCLLSKDTPLLEVLRLFPNAKKEAVNALLEKHAFEVHSVVQTMLDSGYEKEETEDSQDVKNEHKTTVKHDFTSNAWETSAEYRKDALNELQRNFPFLTQPGLQAYFKKEKYHFYHTLVGIEKRLKVSGLYFSHSRVQQLAVAISGESAATNSTSTTTTNTNTSPALKRDVKNEPDVIDLLDSQPQTFDFTSDSPSKPTNTDTTTTTNNTTTPSSSRKKDKSSTARMLSAYNSKFLTKEQTAELRKRCDKSETGLVVKSVVLGTYTTSSATAEDSSLSYLMQPLDSVLQAEIDYLTEARLKELLLQDYQAAEALNEQIATDEGSLMECGCCYGEYAFEALVQCSEGHLFCKQCLQRYCEQTVFGNGRSTLKCMCTAEVCEGFFSDSMLRHSLPEKVFEKFSQALSRDALTAAKMEGLVTCYHCSMQMLMEEDAGSVVHCPYCRHETCRLCNEKSHVPLRCSEVEKKSDTSARLSVEEAMTQARLRECLKCKTKFFKVEGCNKMTCRCGAIICYVCRADISKTGYQHFCQTAHCTHKSCNKCKLFTNTLEDDRVAMKEAGLQQLLEEQQKLEKENEGKGKGGAQAATGTGAGAGAGLNKPGVVGLDLEKLLEGGAINAKAGPAGAVRGGAGAAQAHAQAIARAHMMNLGGGRGGVAPPMVPPVVPPVPGPVGGFGVGAQVMGFLHDAMGGFYNGFQHNHHQHQEHQRALAAHHAAQQAAQAAQQAQQAAQQAQYAEEQRRYQARVEAHRAAEAAAEQRRAAKQQQQADAAAARQHRAEQKAAQKAATEERRRQAQVAKAEANAATAQRAEEFARQQAAARAAEAGQLMREAREAETQALTLAQRNAQARKAEAEAAARQARAADEAALAATRKRTQAMAQLDTAAAIPAVPVPVVQPLRQRAVAAPAPFPLRVAAAPGPPPPPPPLVGLQYVPPPPPPLGVGLGFGFGFGVGPRTSSVPYSAPLTTVKTETVVKPERTTVKTEATVKAETTVRTENTYVKNENKRVKTEKK